MNLGQFKDPVCYLCLFGCVVTSCHSWVPYVGLKIDAE